CAVLEMPGFDQKFGLPVFTRDFEISSTSVPLKLLVCEVPNSGVLVEDNTVLLFSEETISAGPDKNDKSSKKKRKETPASEKNEKSVNEAKDKKDEKEIAQKIEEKKPEPKPIKRPIFTGIGFSGAPEGTRFENSKDGRVYLRLPVSLSSH